MNAPHPPTNGAGSDAAPPAHPLRRRVLMALLVLGIGLIVERVIAFGGSDGSTAPAASDERPARDATAPTSGVAVTAAALRLERLAQHSGLGDAGSAAATMFSPRAPTRPPPRTVEPLPRPIAPPFPYAYVGGMTDAGQRTAFFQRGDRVLVLRSGETVDGSFHIDDLNENQMTVTYLPLKEAVQLTLGGGR